MSDCFGRFSEDGLVVAQRPALVEVPLHGVDLAVELDVTRKAQARRCVRRPLLAVHAGHERIASMTRA